MSRKNLLAALGACLAALGAPAVAQAATWSVIGSPNPTQNDSLNGVARVPGTTQFWAVGTATNAAGVSQPTIVRTTGSTWSMLASPALPTGGGLNDVAALSTTNAWAVGYRGDATPQPLAEHWNGKTWQLVSLPTENATLEGVKVFSASDVLAVGSLTNGPAIAYHWNGSAWSIATLPLPASCAGQPAAARAVAAVPGSTTRFAVGACNQAGGGIVWKLAGGAWSVAWTGDELLNDITPVSAKSIWAVGSKGSSASLVHWNGKTWSSTPVPTNLSDDIFLYGVIRVPGTQTLWAVGGILAEPDIPVAAYYNGSTWSRVFVPGWLWGDLFSVAASSASNLYAVGANWDVSTGNAGCSDADGCPATTLTERYH
jgi:hypothetical protein